MSLDLTETDTLVVGAGQAGVAMSEHLGKLGIPHLVLERHRIAERWRSERWDSLVANGPAAVRACKRLVQDLAQQPLSDELRADTARRIADIRGSAEGKEGVSSFLQKRPPAWLA